jgi:phosphatidylglycerol:prolipoprotein diacylglycerol transferase
LYPRLLQFGHIAIPTYGALTALALVAGLAAAVYFARRLGLDPNKIWSLCLAAIFTALAGARLLLIVGHFSAFREHPFWILGLTTIHEEWVVMLSGAAGLMAAILYALAEGLPVLGVLDCLAPAAALGGCINRVGAFISGLDFGVLAQGAWSVTYTSRIAALWYRTPVGIALYPVQLYEAIASLLTLGLLVWWMPRRSQAGELAGAGLFLYGICSFVVSFYRASADVLPLTQILAVAAVIAGGALWVRRRQRDRVAASDLV